MNTNRMALVERLRNSMARIGKMCGDGTPPRMSIPVRQDDDDVFICNAIKDAIAALQASDGAALMAEAVQIEPVAWIEWNLELDEGDPNNIVAQQTKPNLYTEEWDWKPLFLAAPQQSAPQLAVQVEQVEQMTDGQIHKGLHRDFPESSENMRLAYFAGVRFAEGRAALEAVQVEPILMQPRATFTPEIWETAEWAIPLHIHPLDTDTWDVPNCAGNWNPPTPEQVRRYIAQAIHRYIEAVQASAQEQRPDYCAGFIAGQRYAEKQAESVSVKPLTKKQILELIHAKHVHKDYVLRESDRACLDWYELGLRDGEAAHGIKEPS